MFAIIFVNCAFLVMDNSSVDPYSTVGKLLRYSDIAFTSVFTVEALAKIIALGFTIYIKRVSNVVDFLIVVTGLLLIAIDTANIKFLKGLRVLRAFKPLRLLTKSAGMQLVMRSLILSLASPGPSCVRSSSARILYLEPFSSTNPIAGIYG